MSDPDSVEQLRSELKKDLDFIRRNYRKNREMTERIEAASEQDEYEYAALGYTLHNLYNALESYFLRIAKYFENNLSSSGWHRSLIERMTLDIDGVRPALFDDDFSIRVDELMRFRHLFRNLYKTPLDPQKVRFANGKARSMLEEFERYHERFDEFLKRLKSELERE